MEQLRKGVDVFLREKYPTKGKTGKRQKYRIRSMGKKQAIIDRLDEKGFVNNGIFYTGSTYYLSDPTYIQNWRDNHQGNELPHYIHENWLEFFTPAGNGKWDTDENFF